MVDVGAGSVDSSLFHVKPARGKMGLRIFTSIVEPHGVSEPPSSSCGGGGKRRFRSAANPKAGLISSALAEHKYPTDRTVALPSRFTSLRP